MYIMDVAELPSHITNLVTKANQELGMIHGTLHTCLRLGFRLGFRV